MMLGLSFKKSSSMIGQNDLKKLNLCMDEDCCPQKVQIGVSHSQFKSHYVDTVVGTASDSV